MSGVETTARARDPHRSTGPPLLVSDDPAVVEVVCRLAGAAGTRTDVVPTGPAARRPWAAAPLVLVGADIGSELVDLRLPRRPGIVVVAPGPADPQVWRWAVAVGAEEVLSLRADRDRLVELLATSDGSGEAPLVCVTGGCGGAGTSVLAAAVAYAGTASGLASVLVDADPWGGGVDLLVGAERCTGLRWADLADTTGRVNATSLRELLPVVDHVALLSWGRGDPPPVVPGSMRAVLTAARGGHDLVVADVPRREDEAAVEALAAATCTVLVVPAEVRAVAAAQARVAALRRATVRLALVVRTAGRAGLDAVDVADALDLPLLEAMAPERGLAGWLDQGLGPVRRARGPLARAARSVIDACVAPAPASRRSRDRP